MQAVLSDDELKLIMEGSSLGINTAINSLEGKILEEISQILSGRRTTLESYENSKELRILLQNQSSLTHRAPNVISN